MSTRRKLTDLAILIVCAPTFLASVVAGVVVAVAIAALRSAVE